MINQIKFTELMGAGMYDLVTLCDSGIMEKMKMQKNAELIRYAISNNLS